MKSQIHFIFFLFFCSYMFVFSSCNLNDRGLSEGNLSNLSKLINSNSQKIEQSLDTCASSIYGNQYNLYCFYSENDVSEYKLLKSEENEGKVIKYAVAKEVTYSKGGIVKVIALSGNFKTPQLFEDANTSSTFDNKIIKKVTLNKATYFMMCYNREHSLLERYTSCNDSKILDKPVLLEKTIILFQDENLPETLYKMNDNFYTYLELF